MYNLYKKYKHDYKTLFDTFLQTGGAVQKWKTLEHNGVMFHPLYVPHGIPITYNGETVRLPPELEEYLTYYVHPRYDKYRNEKFAKNFFKSWKTLFSPELKNKIKHFDLVDATEITKHVAHDIEKHKELNKLKTKDQRDAEKNKTLPYKYAIVDGKQQEIDNFIVEPPTIFIGRGNHPLIGSIKYRIRPEDVTINIGRNTTIPQPYINGIAHKWREIIHDNTLEWIASWQNNVTTKTNYARFGRKSIFKMKSDEKKYDLAKKLKGFIGKIRQKNTENLQSNDQTVAQLATALYFIDTLALRAGNEKRTDEADTVGVTTLKIKNVLLEENNQIKLDFLGKDSVRYVNKIVVPDQVYANLQTFIKDKDKNDPLFDRINSDQLNNYLKSFMKGLTSKVFRTYNASHLMQIELNKIAEQLNSRIGKTGDLLQEVKYLYNLANLKVAKLCNHQKILSQSASTSLSKINEKIKELKQKASKTEAQKKRLVTLKNKKKLATASKTLAAGTSKINYIDPRITIAFLKKMGLIDQISAFFNESQRKQFAWAIDIADTYKF